MDKILKRYIFITILLIFIMTFSYAITIDEQIEAIKNAPEPKRVELMNQFKRQLVLMNQKQREKAINRLRYSINGKREVNDNSVSSIHSNLINNIESSNIEQNTQIINHHILQQEINNFAQADREPEPITEPTTPTVPQTPVEPEPTTPTVPETPVEPEPTTEPTTPIVPQTPVEPEPTIEPTTPTVPETPVEQPEPITEPTTPTVPQTPVEPEPTTEPTTPTVPETPVEPEPTTEPTTPTVPQTPVEPEPTTEPTTQPESSSGTEQQSDTTIESSTPKEDEQLEHNSNVSPSRGRSR
ncbi:MAG: hypothetical protein GXO60_00440 [Epsilonproteobacteria bacterium]|nr:hypothetical protein [Campylobacterota bacterium]